MRKFFIALLIVLLNSSIAGAWFSTPPSSNNASTLDGHAASYFQVSHAYLTDIAGISAAAGDVIYFNGTNWVRLAKDAGKYLKSGASAVSWDTPSGSMATDTIWAAAGDLAYGTANDTGGILSIGTAYQVLHTNSGATAPAWTSTLGAAGTKLTAGYFTTLYADTFSTTAADGSRALFLPNNTSYTPGAGEYSLYMDNGVPTFSVNGVEQAVKAWPSGTSVSICNDGSGNPIACTSSELGGIAGFNATPAGAGVIGYNNGFKWYDTALRTAVSTDKTETLTNKTLALAAITSDEVDGHADSTSLTAANLSRTVINSYGRTGAATLTLPTAAEGYTAIFIVGTQHNSAWKIQRAGSDTITWSSGGTDTAGKTYFQETNQAVGSRVSCMTYQTGASAWTWLCGPVTGTWVTD